MARSSLDAIPATPEGGELSAEQLGRMRDTAVRFVERSKVLGTLVVRVELTRGRVYVWRDETDLMARITPLSSVTFLLEAQRGNGWSEHARGTLRVVLGALERDRLGGFHGLGALARKPKTGDASVLVRCIARSAFRSTSSPSRVSGMRFGGNQKSPSTMPHGGASSCASLPSAPSAALAERASTRFATVNGVTTSSSPAQRPLSPRQRPGSTSDRGKGGEPVPAGDAQRVWFPEMLEVLTAAWSPTTSWDELVDLCGRLTDLRTDLRRSRGILAPLMKCPKCGSVSRGDIKGVSIRSALFALRRSARSQISTFNASTATGRSTEPRAGWIRSARRTVGRRPRRPVLHPGAAES